MAAVVHIFIAGKPGAPMKSVPSVLAAGDGGLRGDRYADHQVTFIELENIEAFTATTGLELAPEGPRRNIVTRGVRLNDLSGRRFRIGAVVFEGIELCEPCSLFARRTHREILDFFPGRAGLRARVVTGGEIRVGEAIENL